MNTTKNKRRNGLTSKQRSVVGSLRAKATPTITDVNRLTELIDQLGKELQSYIDIEVKVRALCEDDDATDSISDYRQPMHNPRSRPGTLAVRVDDLLALFDRESS